MRMTRYLIFSILVFGITLRVFADEGMYPISELQKINMKQKGLKIKTADIYNPNNVSLIHAIVSLGFCTGSFVSDQGLILTNHHCAFGAVQTASSTADDYIQNGFLANIMEEEIPAKDYTVRITETYQDVTDRVMKGVTDTLDALIRAKTISANIKVIADKARQDHPDQQVEIAEMLPGKSYVMFLYTLLKDIRLVYVPPRSIGEFGGEDDNWMWPRHTGDFAFIRAYVSKDGKPTPYSKDNVPYKPKIFLHVSAKGIGENDFVFILGYPGRTFRHRPGEFLSYENDIRMPYLADMLEWQIQVMETMSRNDHATGIKLAQRIKSLANQTKNFRGKLKSIKEVDLINKKKNEENDLWSFIKKDDFRKSRYGRLSENISTIFGQLRRQADYEFVLDYLRRSVSLVEMGYGLIEALVEKQKPNNERRVVYKDENRSMLITHLSGKLFNYHEPTDQLFFEDLLKRSQKLPAGYRFDYADRLLQTATTSDSLTKKMYLKTRLNKDTAWAAYLLVSPADIPALDDPMLTFIYEYYKAVQNFYRYEEG